MEQKISIVIPTKDRENQLNNLLTSIYASSIQPKEVIVINNSTNKLNTSFSECKIHDNSINKGLAQARTLGATMARGKYVLFVDDDNVLDPNLLLNLQITLDNNNDVMAVGPITYYLSDKKTIWFLSGGINLMTSKAFFNRELAHQNDIFYDTNILHNCFLIRKNLGDEVGWFDERIFMSGTEFDLFKKISKMNKSKRLVTNVEAKCYHDIPQKNKDILRNYGFSNELRVYYFQRNRGLIVGKYGTLLNKIALGFVFYPLFFITYGLLFFLTLKPKYFLSHLKATISGYYYLISS